MFPRFIQAFWFVAILLATGCTPEKLRDTSDNASPSRDRTASAGSRTPAPRTEAGSDSDYKTYFFCTWNVENFYDDQDDPKSNDEMENWYGKHPDMFKLKVKHLTEALLMMNNGRGPDILCLCEVESYRSMDALRNSLNASLEEQGLHAFTYQNIIFKEDLTGRRFTPAILTRLPVIADKTRKLGSGGYRRIVEGHIDVNGYDLTVIAGHWTSRVNNNTESHRMNYAESCYGRFRAIATSNPDADVIVCGDFNDEFHDDSVQKGLRASDDLHEVIQGKSGDDLKLFDLSARFDGTGATKGTIYGRGKWATFDHICVSRGMLDGKGWVCDPKTAAIFAPKELRKQGRNSRGEPFPFGNEKTAGERGYSDHFPVTVQIRVQNFQ